MQSTDLTQRNIDAIAALFPAIVTETLDADGSLARAIDFDLLRQELSDEVVVVEDPQERYQLDWPGKREALFAANAPIAKTLRPVREESVDFDRTRNLFIEGDNLDALKLLQESYLGKVNVIYIDPPYNTGNDLVYADDFAISTAEYLARSRQVDDNRMRLAANTESNGRFHSDWLSMMYPRLKLARNLLREDGIIFISIDDNEADNLLRLCKEVFGDSNHVATFTWVKKKKGSHLSKTVRSMTEYVVCFARNIALATLVGEAAYSDKWQPLAKRTNAQKTLYFPAAVVETTLPDGDFDPGLYGRGTSALRFADGLMIRSGHVQNGFSVHGPFVWTQEKLNSELALGTRVALSRQFGFNALRHDQESKVKRPSTLIDRTVGVGTNEDAYQEGIDLFGLEGVMDYPKPTSLVQYLLRAATWYDSNSLILDFFFAGSGTTGHAVMALNEEDGGDRNYILVQIAENTGDQSSARKAGFSTIAEVARERLRLAARSLEPKDDSNTGIRGDLGFRSLKVDSTNMADVLRTPDALGQDQLSPFADSVKSGRSGEDLLFQVMLDWGLELTMPITVEKVEGHEVFNVEDGALMACFGADVSSALVRKLASREPLRAVFRDSGFASDADRINAEQVFHEVSPATDVKAI